MLLLAGESSGAESANHAFYAGLGIGWNYAARTKPGDGAIIDYDFGLPAGSLAFGMGLGERWRAELELSHQENEPEILYFRDSDLEIDPDESDRLAATSLMLNAYRDLNLGIAFRPYLGLGIGASKVRLRFTDKEADDGAGVTLIDDDAVTFAWQLATGVTVPLTRGLDLGVEYRFWQAPWLELTDVEDNRREFSQTTHSGWLRLNYRPGRQSFAAASVPSHPAPGARGLYLAASVGAGWGVDTEMENTRDQLDAYAPGPNVNVALGYRLNRRWRLELEAAHRRNDMQILDEGRLEGEQRTTGDVRSDTLSLNAIYRFRPASAINPIVGVGIGVARTRYDVTLAASNEPYLRDQTTSATFQWMIGFDFALTERWTVTTDYRMWASAKASIDHPDGSTVKSSLVFHTMTIGLRYQLGGD